MGEVTSYSQEIEDRMFDCGSAAYAAGFNTEEILTLMIAIAGGESSWVPEKIHYNKNGSTDYGLWQINKRAHPHLFKQYNWRIPYDNAAMAMSVKKSQGLRAWVVYTDKKHLQYMNESRKVAKAILNATQTPQQGTPSQPFNFNNTIPAPPYDRPNKFEECEKCGVTNIPACLNCFTEYMIQAGTVIGVNAALIALLIIGILFFAGNTEKIKAAVNKFIP